MTDYSVWTDEQVNEAVFKAKGWVQLPPPAAPPWQRPTEKGVESWFFSFPPDYTHDWRLAGELLEEMPDYIELCRYKGAWDCTQDFLTISAPTPQRAICEAWLAWKEQG